jgi:hypothetical protein
VYWDGSYHGQVLDAETKAPLEGAVVVAVYHESCYRFIQTNSKEIGVQEVLTDATGKFRILAFWTISTPDCWYEDTGFHVFKPRYAPFPPGVDGPGIPTYAPSNPKLDVYQEIFRAGVILELPPLKTREEMEKAYPSGPSVSNRLEKKLKNYYRLENELRILLGYEPYKSGPRAWRGAGQ